MDLLSMWACIQDHDTAGHWKQVAGWRKVCDLAQAHLGRLKEYRRGLAEAWPPATNAAARAYLGELDDLIDKVQRTHDTAAANYDALAAATRAISSARVELKPLHDEYVTKLQQKRTYEATLADPKAAMGSRVPDKPVTDVDLERLNAQARNLMYGLSGELQQAQVMLRQPPPPPPRPGRQPNDPDVYGGGTIPVIPPVLPVPITAPTTTSSIPSLKGPRTASSANRAPIIGPTIGAGPVLGGAGAGLTNPPSSPPSSGGLPITSTPPLGPGASFPPSIPNALGIPSLGNSAGQTENQSSSINRLGNRNASGLNSSPPPHPLSPGGLIGGPPGMGMSQHANSQPPRRINPIGGVIGGGGGAGTSPTGGAGSRPGAGRGPHLGATHAAPPFGNSFGAGGASSWNGMPGRPSSQAQNDANPQHWDPDHPWATNEGVPPVVHPPTEDGPIDPGPVIGFDR